MLAGGPARAAEPSAADAEFFEKEVRPLLAEKCWGCHGEDRAKGAEGVYLRLLRHIEERHDLRLRVLADIVAGASAGGINGVFLAQAIHSGQSLEPLPKRTVAQLDRVFAE